MFFTCNTDSNNGNPRQDCSNSIIHYCKKGAESCKKSVDLIFKELSIYWRTWRIFCGLWSWPYSRNTVSGISNCIGATNALKANAKYFDQNGVEISVPEALIESADTILWKNPNMK